jgi:hypothetical protein
MAALSLALVALGACHEEGRIGAVPADPGFDASVVEELPQDGDAGARADARSGADATVIAVSETFGQPCEGPEECSSAICFEYKVEDDEQGFCTQTCEGRCAIDDHVCFLGHCVPTTYCEGDGGGGLGPGCDGSPCERCTADEQCVAGEGRGEYRCVADDA